MEAGEVEVGDGDATTGLSRADVAGLILRIGDKDVPLAIDHVGEEIVRSTRVVRIIP